MGEVLFFVFIVVAPFVLVLVLDWLLFVMFKFPVQWPARKGKEGIKIHLLTVLKNYYLDKNGFNYRIYLLVVVYAIYGLLDYRGGWSQIERFDLEGWGIINGSQELVLYFTLLAIIIYTLETYRLRDVTYESSEAIKSQNELQLRPYLSLHWNSSCKSSGRRGNLTDTCLEARNDGKGLMRRVNYRVKVNGSEVLVRNHNTITSGRHGTAIVYSSENDNCLLGDRNHRDQVSNNERLISEEIETAKITGMYEDLNGTEYEYSIKKGDNEQSRFEDVFPQRRKKSKTTNK